MEELRKEYYNNTSVSTLLPPTTQVIYNVGFGDKVSKALRLMIKHNILSLPVFNNRRQMYVCFVDMLDILLHVLTKVEGLSSEQDLIQIVEQGAFKDTTCKDIANLSERNPFEAIGKEGSLLDAIGMMVKPQLHRLAVVDNDGTLLTIITQSHIIRLINDHLDHLGDLPSQSIRQLGIGYRKVVTVKHDSVTLEAFKKIAEESVSGVGVVDDNGNIIGNVSATDLKLIGHNGELLSLLQSPVESFLEVIKGTNEGVERGSVVSVCSDDTFGDVIRRVVLHRVHRIYIVDNLKPVGVFSLSDILSTVYSLLSQ